MKINDEDRSIAKEIADLLDVPADDVRTHRMLAIVFWAHRQLPADEKPAPSGCTSRSVHSIRLDENTNLGPGAVRCQQQSDHPGPVHIARIGGMTVAWTDE